MKNKRVQLGKRCPFRVLPDAAALHAYATGFTWLLGCDFGPTESETLSRGRLSVFMRKIQHNGKPFVHAGIGFTDLDTFADCLMFATESPDPLSDDRTISYECHVISVNYRSQKVMGLRPFSFHREISELIYEVSRTPVTVVEFSEAAEWLGRQVLPAEIFKNRPAGYHSQYSSAI